MKKITFLVIVILLPMLVKSQEMNTISVNSSWGADWNKLKYSGFYEGGGGSTSNSPDPSIGWYWGLNIGHKTNTHPVYLNSTYNYNGQLLFGNMPASVPPRVFVRSTNQQGEGMWAKLIHDQGDQLIQGRLTLTGADLLIKYPSGGTGGRALVHDGGNKLIINYSGDFSGGVELQGPKVVVLNKIGIATSNPQHALDVNGTIKTNAHIQLAGQLSASLNDNLTYQGKSFGHYAMGWNPDSWSNNGYTLWQSGFGGIKFFTMGVFRMGINDQGNVGIGTDKPQVKLDVKGTVRAEAIEVQLTSGADFVFEKDYNLRPLSEVEAFVKENKHLPEIQSEKQMKEEGLNMNAFQIKLLQKIEELTLYTIQQEKRLENQETKIKELQQQLKSK